MEVSLCITWKFYGTAFWMVTISFISNTLLLIALLLAYIAKGLSKLLNKIDIDKYAEK